MRTVNIRIIAVLVAAMTLATAMPAHADRSLDKLKKAQKRLEQVREELEQVGEEGESDERRVGEVNSNVAGEGSAAPAAVIAGERRQSVG